MKHWFLTITILSASTVVGFGQGNDRILSKYFTFKENVQAFTYGDNVKLRSAPNTDNVPTTIIPINSELRIISMTTEAMDYDGISTPWYKVKYKYKTGFVLGGLIALQRFELDDHYFLVQLSENENQKISLKVRITSISQASYTESVFDLIGEQFEINIEDNNRGLSRINNLIGIDYLSEACGVEGGITYLTWEGSDIRHFADCSRWSDAGIAFMNEEIIFPLDSLGIEEKIIFQSIIISNEDEATQWTKTTTERREHTWD